MIPNELLYRKRNQGPDAYQTYYSQEKSASCSTTGTLYKGIVRSSILLKVRFLSDDLEIDNVSKEAGNKIVQLIQQGMAGTLSSTQDQDSVSFAAGYNWQNKGAC